MYLIMYIYIYVHSGMPQFRTSFPITSGYLIHVCAHPTTVKKTPNGSNHVMYVCVCIYIYMYYINIMCIYI